MKLIVILVTLTILIATTAAATTSPNVVDTFCSDIVETLKINGKVERTDSFKLCMDVKSLSWRRDDVVGDMTRSQIFANSNITMVYEVFFDDKMKAINCTSIPPRSPTTANDLPFRFAQLDALASLNATTKVDGVEALDYRHMRPAKKVGPGFLPAEDMNWLISKEVTDNAQDLLQTSCVETVKGEGTSDGIRNFQKKYTRDIPTGTFEVPQGVKCVPAKPPKMGEKSYSDARFNLEF